ALEPLEPEGRIRALNWLAETLGVGKSFSPPVSPNREVPRLSTDDASVVHEMTPKQFVALKKPKTDVERITCLAYYLTHARETMHFKTADLTALNQEAAGVRFGNASQTASNAMNQNGYLAQAGRGNRQITP